MATGSGKMFMACNRVYRLIRHAGARRVLLFLVDRSNRRFTLKNNPLTRADLDDFVACFNPEYRKQREEAERFRRFTYDKLVKRDKANLYIFWLRDESVEDTATLLSPNVIADEILEDLRAAL